MPVKKKILLVDDEKVVRLSFKRELQPLFEVRLAASCSEALEILAGERFDLLITDLVMPDDDGLTLLRRAKASSPQLYVIIITGYGEIETVVAAMRAGADDFLLKPCDIDELLERIAQVFERDDYMSRVAIYDKMCKATTIFVALVDTKGIIVEANAAWQRACSFDRQELRGRSLAEVLGRQSLERTILPLLQGCLRQGAVQHHGFFRFADGRPRSMAVTLDPVPTGGTVTLAVLSLTDVSAIMAEQLPLQKRAEQLQLAHSIGSEGFMDFDVRTGQTQYCTNWKHLLGYEADTADGDLPSLLELADDEDSRPLHTALAECLDGLRREYRLEVRLRTASGSWRWFRTWGMVVEQGGDGAPRRLIGILADIDHWKKREKRAVEEIEALKAQCDAGREQCRRLDEELAEAGTAWKVLQHKRDRDRKILEGQLSDNVVNVAAPLVKRLQKTGLNDKQRQLVEALGETFAALTSSFVTSLASRHIGLTPMEIQVANHVRNGKATKEIADILCLAPETVNVHRKKIRRKLGLSNTAVNLHTFLNSLAEEAESSP